MVGPGGAVLSSGNLLRRHPSPLRHLGLAPPELGLTPCEETTGAVELGEYFGEGLVSAGVEGGLPVEPGLTLHEHGGGAGAGVERRRTMPGISIPR